MNAIIGVTGVDTQKHVLVNTSSSKSYGINSFQAKTVTPTASQQVVTADSGNLLYSVTVNGADITSEVSSVPSTKATSIIKVTPTDKYYVWKDEV